MGSNESRPGGCGLALRGGRQTMAPQDIANRLIADLIPQIGQCSYNPVIAPIPVLLGHADDQLLDLSADPRRARSLTGLRAIEFAGHHFAVPSQDRVWSGHSRHLSESLAPQTMTELAQRGSLGVGELQSRFRV